ncbi:hypothetical protein ASL14_23270 [Paenibacillus sp. IHB B 3084]|uniref:hypothetical protein n=1 Tax=Paenibacillus TaxID=44249 RepID=UPI0004724FFF|nr:MULTISPECIES: hypothetical protein [Paenibacillus]ALP38658.1 hypothetical protein ASL14_23270 [Paenibacillus sp. IHB B 3084]MBE0335894.1 hypothetical protein [Paenibacillus sp. 23TSA30-6]
MDPNVKYRFAVIAVTNSIFFKNLNIFYGGDTYDGISPNACTSLRRFADSISLLNLGGGRLPGILKAVLPHLGSSSWLNTKRMLFKHFSFGDF